MPIPSKHFRAIEARMETAQANYDAALEEVAVAKAERDKWHRRLTLYEELLADAEKIGAAPEKAE